MTRYAQVVSNVWLVAASVSPRFPLRDADRICLWDVLARKRFTKAQVNYLVAASKFIKYIPEPRPIHPQSGSGVRIQIEVYKKSEPKKPIKGLLIIATAHSSPAGVRGRLLVPH
jgi:hypothetical protein